MIIKRLPIFTSSWLSLVLLFHCTTINTQMRRIFAMAPCLKYQLVHAPSTVAREGFSLTHKHAQKILNKNVYSRTDLGDYFNGIYDFHYNDSTVDLVLQGIALEKQFSTTHHAFYHGTSATKFILLRTMLAQVKQRKQYQDLFLLRNKGELDHLRGISSGYRYAMNHINSLYISKNSLGRFDNDQPMRSDLLSVNTAMLAGVKELMGEDSMSYLDTRSRFGPNGLNQKIKECLSSYGINNLPEKLLCFLQERKGSMLVLFIPRNLSSLTYVSAPCGIPVGLPPGTLLVGDKSLQEVQKILQEHKERSTEDFFKNPDQFEQARIVLNPHYFEDDTQQIKMFLFVWEYPEFMKEHQDNLLAIKSLAQARLTS